VTNPTSNKRAGKAFEYRIRDLLIENGWQAERVPLSGMISNHKGDIRAECNGISFLIECKKSRSDSIKVKGEWLKKISKEAEDINRTPALIHGTLNSKPFITIPFAVFDMLVKRAEAKVIVQLNTP
jgi:Holliday junction resolvase